MTLYEINQAQLNMIETEDGFVNAATGELFTAEDLESLAIEKDAVIENIALWVKNLDAEAKALKEEESALQERRKAKEKKIESLKRLLSDSLAGKKFETAKVAMSFRKSTAVNVVDETAIPSGYLIEQAPKIDKTAIKKALQAGIEVAGCTLEERQNLQIK